MMFSVFPFLDSFSTLSCELYTAAADCMGSVHTSRSRFRISFMQQHHHHSSLFSVKAESSVGAGMQ